MESLDAILASMAAKTGYTISNSVIDDEKDDNPSCKRKSEHVEDGMIAESSLIWNPNVCQPLSDTILEYTAQRANKISVNPSMEIARQQVVRQLCKKIRKISEQMGITKLPNSVYETWQFTSQLTVIQVDPLIPHGTSDYSGLYEELIKAGATRRTAKKHCVDLTREAEKLHRRFVQQNFDSKKKIKVVEQYDGYHVLTCGHVTVKLSSVHLKKLRRMYEQHCRRIVTNDDVVAFEAAVFSLLLRYDSLDGGGFQAALNEECFDSLLQYFDCKMECFASPLNSRYSRFCSAFLDTDYVFGSMGSFFDFMPKEGCFEANPPFIPKLILRMADHMSSLLTVANGALMFIIIIPAWKHTEGWQQLFTSRYNQKHVLIPQNEHGYCEGKQHIRKTRWRIASFDTSVFFWQNINATRKWPITDTAIDHLRTAFGSKQAGERDQLGMRKSGKRVRVKKQ